MFHQALTGVGVGRLNYQAQRALERRQLPAYATMMACTGSSMSEREYVWPQPPPEENPLHDAKWFIEHGEDEARRQTNYIAKACKYALLLIAIGYGLSLLNQYGALG